MLKCSIQTPVSDVMHSMSGHIATSSFVHKDDGLIRFFLMIGII